MDQHAGPSDSTDQPAVNLLELPDNCLHRIVRFMDPRTMKQFFRVSKGSQDKPGCGVLVLRACQAKYRKRYRHRSQPPPSASSILHWAAQVSSGIEMEVACYSHGIEHILTNLTVKAIPASPSQLPSLSAATYPGITSLELSHVRSQCLIPERLTATFPNLRQLRLFSWSCTDASPSLHVDPDVPNALPQLKQLSVQSAQEVTEQLRQHIIQTLSRLPSLTALGLDDITLEAAPASVLSKLTHLTMWCSQEPTDKLKTALSACVLTRSVCLYGLRGDEMVAAVSEHVPTVCELDIGRLSELVVPYLISLPQLCIIRPYTLSSLMTDFSHATVGWKQLLFRNLCDSSITKLPLDTLDAVIVCRAFSLQPSHDHAADLAAIRRAKPHLLRCGGIDVKRSTLLFETHGCPTLTAQHASELLHEWKPCLSAIQRVEARGDGVKALIKDAVAQLWPQAEIEQYRYWSRYW